MPDAVFLLRCGCERFDNGLMGRFLKKEWMLFCK